MNPLWYLVALFFAGMVFALGMMIEAKLEEILQAIKQKERHE